MRLFLVALVAAVAISGCQTTDEGGTAVQQLGPAVSTDLSDLVGVKGGNGEIALRNRGYELARSEGLTSYYYNAAARDCARVVTADGRYQSIDKVRPRQCRTGSGGTATQLPAATPTPAEQACLRDVTRTTNNPDVVLLDSSFSQAGTEVIVGVGPQRAPWRCIAYSDGTTAGIQSLTNEGTL